MALAQATQLVLASTVLPNWVVMWGMAVVVFGVCKWLTLSRFQGTASVRRRLLYIFCEPGLNAKRFLASNSKVEPPRHTDWLRAIAFTLTGAICFLALPPLTQSVSNGLTATVGMIGIVLMLHFGVLDLFSLILRRNGILSTSLMNAPWQATGVAEFWSRWNTGFRDLSREMIFYPLVRRRRAKLGLWATFLFSGLVHDLVISIPAHGGYGGPTLYFLTQAVAVTFERSKLGKRLGVFQSWQGRLFTVAVVLLPVTLLFHFPFQENVVLPMLVDLEIVPK